MKFKFLILLLVAVSLIGFVSADSQTIQIRFIVPNPEVVNTPTTVQNITGVTTSGNVIGTQYLDDNLFYNLTEVTGVPGYDIRFNFTNFTEIGNVSVIAQYEGNPAHDIYFQAWNGSSWNTITQIFDINGYGNFTGGFNGTEYNISGKIQGRIYHETPGVGTHWISIDYILLSGYEVPSPDTEPPTFDDLRNFTHEVSTTFSEDIDATDNIGVSCFGLNDTSTFDIDCSGTIANVTVLESITIYWLNVSVNDTVGNTNFGEFYINVVDATGEYSVCSYSKYGYYDDSLSFFREKNCVIVSEGGFGIK